MKLLLSSTPILIAILLTSCSTSKSLTSSVKPNEIKDLQRFETLSYISFIEKGNNAVYNDTISNLSKKLFSQTLDTYSNLIPMTDNINITDINVKRLMEREAQNLCLAADQQQTLQHLKLSPTLDSLLEMNQKRFGLITITTGFTRRKGNYRGQIAKGVGVGILTLGMFYPAPIKANSTVYIMIVDAQLNNIAFFRKSSLADKEPLNENVLDEQIFALIDGYFTK